MMEIWKIITFFGDIQFWIGIVVASLLFYHILSNKEKKKFSWIIFALIPTIILTSVVCEVIKDTTKIPRPCINLDGCPDGYSFPSRHAALSFSFAVIVSLATRKKELISIFFILAILVSLSRIFLNYHTFQDVIIGILIGLISGYFVYIIYQKFFKYKYVD